MEKRLGPFPSTPDGAPAPTLGERSGAPSGLCPSSFVMCNTPVEVQFTSAGCLNYPCRTPLGILRPRKFCQSSASATICSYHSRKETPQSRLVALASPEQRRSRFAAAPPLLHPQSQCSQR